MSKKRRPPGRRSKDESLPDKLVRRAAQTVIAPRWRRHVDHLLKQQPDIDAVLVITVPLNHIPGLAQLIITDSTTSLCFSTMATCPPACRILWVSRPGSGFTRARTYPNIRRFSPTARAANRACAISARGKCTRCFMARTRTCSARSTCRRTSTRFFYGHGREYRAEWIEAMVREPSLKLPEATFRRARHALGRSGPCENAAVPVV